MDWVILKAVSLKDRGGLPLKIRFENEPWLIIILTILLVVIITFLPSNVLRIILGLPLVLFFPGYMLIAALFPRKEALGRTERLALGFGVSVAVVGLIVYVLNYTLWGIRLYPVLISIALFVTITSIITWYRRHRLPKAERANVAFHITRPHLREMDRWSKALSVSLFVILVMLLLAGIGGLSYLAFVPEAGERFAEFNIPGLGHKLREYPGEAFTEFYVLGLGHKVTDYPKELAVGERGVVIVVIVNHEKAEASYWIEVRIDGETNGEVGPIVLDNEQKWEERISFIPKKAGDNQKVEFLLFKEGEVEPSYTLHLVVDVKEKR